MSEEPFTPGGSSSGGSDPGGSGPGGSAPGGSGPGGSGPGGSGPGGSAPGGPATFTNSGASPSLGTAASAASAPPDAYDRAGAVLGQISDGINQQSEGYGGMLEAAGNAIGDAAYGAVTSVTGSDPSFDTASALQGDAQQGSEGLRNVVDGLDQEATGLQSATEGTAGRADSIIKPVADLAGDVEKLGG